MSVRASANNGKNKKMVERTVTNVAGKNVKVTTAMVFMAAPSSLVASAI